MAKDIFKNTPSSSPLPILRRLYFLLFVIAGCVSTKGLDIVVPPHLISELKSHKSIEVWANHPPWTQTGFNLGKGEKVVIFASGQVSVWPAYSSFHNLPPNSRLIMKIGEKYFPRIAVWSWGYSIFSVEDPGQLKYSRIHRVSQPYEL